MNRIFEKQNSEKHLKLLAAQRHLYTKAKKLKSWRMIVSVALVLLGIVFSLFFNKLSVLLSIVAGIIAIVVLLSKNWEKGLTLQAAKIQEEFDTSLFDLPWNGLLVGNRLTREVIENANSDFKGDRLRLRDWYANYNGGTHIQNVLHCQRANLAWDWQLRRTYSNYVIVLVVVLLAAGIVYSLFRENSLYDYLAEIFFPSLSAIIIGWESITEHRNLAKEKEAKEQEVSALLESSNLDLSTARQLQDIIFTFRTSTALVPEFIYKKLWNRYNNNMHRSAEQES